MFKKTTPDVSKVVNQIRQFPHCDSRVLHAPGECEFCDNHPDWQALRIAWGIAFTGYEPEDKELPCPATVRRPLETVNKWGGNTPKPKTSLRMFDEVAYKHTSRIGGGGPMSGD